MWLLLRFSLFCAVLLATSTCDLVEHSSRESRCHLIFPDVLANSEAAGGISIIPGKHRDEMCIYGTLDQVDLTALDAVQRGRRFDVTVHSTGGPVDVWLDLAEKLEGRADSVIVDRACMSSCANYLLPIAGRVVVRRDSLVVWHGSDYVNPQLTVRTEALYRRQAISLAVLRDTGWAPSDEEIGDLRASQPAVLQIIGYAPTPRFLRDCYNFQNLAAFWHPGTVQALNETLVQRSRTSGVLMNPRSQC